MFKKGIISLMVIVSTITFSSQLQAHEKKELYRSVDWVKDNVFTQGVEGPAVAADGVLYAVNYQQEGTIGRVVNKNQVELFTQLDNKSVGNGIRFAKNGDMYIADYVNHNVLVVKTGEKQARVYAHNDMMNQPNDIALMDNGILFASDPNWANNTGQLWRINKDASSILIEKNMGTTNGVEVSPDNQVLYVNESVQRKVWRYKLAGNGAVKNKQLLIKFDDFGLDGMRTDKQGNLYIARYGKGVIAIVSAQGKLLREVKLKGKFPTNVAFGGVDGKTVFVTMQKRGAIEMFHSEYSGRSFQTQ